MRAFVLLLVISFCVESYGNVIKENTKINKLIQEIALINQEFFSGIVSLDIPKSFNELPTHILEKKYPQSDLSRVEVFSNDDFSIGLVFKLIENPSSFSVEDIINQTLQRFEPIPSIEILSGRVRQINKKDIAVIEFSSQAIDSSIYNLMFITVINDKTFIGTFNCTYENIDEWKPLAKDMLSSIKINPN